MMELAEDVKRARSAGVVCNTATAMYPLPLPLCTYYGRVGRSRFQ
jgi:hypothetical protein